MVFADIHVFAGTAIFELLLGALAVLVFSDEIVKLLVYPLFLGGLLRISVYVFCIVFRRTRRQDSLTYLFVGTFVYDILHTVFAFDTILQWAHFADNHIVHDVTLPYIWMLASILFLTLTSGLVWGRSVIRTPLESSTVVTALPCSTTLDLRDVYLRTFVLEEGTDVGNEFIRTEQCCICLDDFQANDVLAEMVCCHVFHKHCVDEHLSHILRVGEIKARLCPMRCDVMRILSGETTPRAFPIATLNVEDVP